MFWDCLGLSRPRTQGWPHLTGPLYPIISTLLIMLYIYFISYFFSFPSFTCGFFFLPYGPIFTFMAYHTHIFFWGGGDEAEMKFRFTCERKYTFCLSESGWLHLTLWFHFLLLYYIIIILFILLYYCLFLLLFLSMNLAWFHFLAIVNWYASMLW